MSALTTRRPTGLPPWPIILLAGAEKAGKSYAAAEASASALIGRTLWVGVGEDDPDEYGALPGARFEIVQHDGSYQGIRRVLVAAAALPPTDGKPNLIVLDSATRLWDLLCDEAQAVADARATRKTKTVVDGADITMDLWNTAKQRWAHIMDALREHAGPSLVTARLEQVTVMANGRPTTSKEWKVKAEKSLPFDVGAVVRMPERGKTYLTGVRSLRFAESKPGEPEPYPSFSVEKLLIDLGIAEPGATSPRQHAGTNAAAAVAEQPGGNPNLPLVKSIGELAAKLPGGPPAVAAAWADEHQGQDIRHATDTGSLQLLHDDLAERVRQASEQVTA